MRPTIGSILAKFKEELLRIARRRKLESSPATLDAVDDAVSSLGAVLRHEWRMHDLMSEHEADSGQALAASAFISDFWVEVTD